MNMGRMSFNMPFHMSRVYKPNVNSRKLGAWFYSALLSLSLSLSALSCSLLSLLSLALCSLCSLLSLLSALC
jgi:hypothetical protein